MSPRADASAAADRRTQAQFQRLERQSLRRGVLSALPLESLTIGVACYFAWLDFERPMEAMAIAVQASDAGLGNLTVALYRARSLDIKAGTWTARRMALVTQTLTATMTEYALELPEDGAARRAALDTADDAFLVGVRGGTATATVRGTSGYTAPSFGGLTITASALPETLNSVDVARTNTTPSVAVLSRTGVRFR